MAAAPRSHQVKDPLQFPIVLTAGFRIYFLAAGVFSVLAMLAWTIWLGVHAAGGAFVSEPFRMAPHLWHAHEMVYGYTVAVMAGFFLTAVPNWTGTREAAAAFVTFTALVWLLGRLVIWFSAALDPLFVALVDLAFIPLIASNILGKLTRKSQARNMVFLVLLCALFAGNLLMHLDWMGFMEEGALAGARLGVFTSAAMIAIIGGRVVPAFTRNVLLREGLESALPVSRIWLDRIGIFAALSAAAACLPFIPEMALGVVCFAAGAINLTRLLGWKGWMTIKKPILWILHASYLLLCAGYLMLGASFVFDVFGLASSLHLLATGAIGGMTLAMMTRASLGHSGRPLKASHATTVAYLAIIAASLVRSFGVLQWDYFTVMLVSGALWILGLGLFVGVYAPILILPRVSK